jgi:hypothetical protein
MRVRPIVPFQQGDLDGLCGLYSIVNAVAVAVLRHPDSRRAYDRVPRVPLRRFNERLAEQLLKSLSRGLQQFGGLPPTFDRGVRTVVLPKLLRRADRHLRLRHGTRLIWSKPFHKRKKVAPAAIVKRVRRYLREPYTAVIVGYPDHWSVIRSASPKRFRLADSSGDLWIATQRRDAKRCGIHVSDIWPTSLFLVRLVSVEQPVRRARP